MPYSVDAKVSRAAGLLFFFFSVDVVVWGWYNERAEMGWGGRAVEFAGNEMKLR